MRRPSVLLLSLYLLPPAALLLTTGASAQQGVAGVVIDQNGGALPRAHVRLVQPDGVEIAERFTDERGMFRFEPAACDECRVEASSPGFTPAAARASAVPLRLTLQVGPIPELVVVSATRGDAPVSQVGSAVTVFDSEEIARRGTPLVSELLRSSPGVAAVRGGGLGNLTTLFVRGGEGSYNKVLLDGIPLNEPGGTFDFSNVTTQALDRVEVLRGAHSALFGTDAMASVVQLVSKRSSRPSLQASVEAGSYDSQRGSLTAGTLRGGLDLSGHVSRQETDNREPNNSFRNTTLAANGGVQLSSDATLRFVARAEIGRVGSPGATAFGRPDLDAFYARRLGVGGVTLQHLRGPWQQRATYAVSASDAESVNRLVDPPYTPQFGGRRAPFQFSDFPYDTNNDLMRHHASYQLDRRVSARRVEHLVTAAVDWDGERAELRDRRAGTVVKASRDNVGGAVQHQLLGRRFALTSGVRLERNDSFGAAIAPRVAFAFVARESSAALGGTRLKASAGAGVKEPTVIQSFSPSPFFLGNADLEPERARTFDAGIEQRLFGNRARIELTAFYGRFENIISTRTLSFNPFRAQYFNIGLTHARGTELSIDTVPMAGLTLRGGHTLLASEVTRSTSAFNPVFAEGQPLFRRPRHSGFVDAAWSRGRVLLAVHGTFVGRRVDSDFSSLEPPLMSNEAYATWDVAGRYRLTRRLTAFAHADNLGDADYMEPLGYLAWRRSARGGLTLEF
jgi:vitamin B12 transporter